MGKKLGSFGAGLLRASGIHQLISLASLRRSRMFGHLVENVPRYGSGEGRELTADERQMLAENTERLIAQFESEHQALLEQERLRQEQQAKVEHAAHELAERRGRRLSAAGPLLLKRLPVLKGKQRRWSGKSTVSTPTRRAGEGWSWRKLGSCSAANGSGMLLANPEVAIGSF